MDKAFISAIWGENALKVRSFLCGLFAISYIHEESREIYIIGLQEILDNSFPPAWSASILQGGKYNNCPNKWHVITIHLIQPSPNDHLRLRYKSGEDRNFMNWKINKTRVSKCLPLNRKNCCMQHHHPIHLNDLISPPS